MPPSPTRRRFIPFAKSDIVDALCSDGALDDEARVGFRAFCELLQSLFHFRFHAKLEALKDAYRPFNPDEDVRPVRPCPPEERRSHETRLFAQLREVLNEANFEPISGRDLQVALAESSIFDISLQVDFDDFESQLVFWRGESVRRARVRRFWFFERELVIPTFDRVVLLIKFKDRAHFDARPSRTVPFEPSSMVLKLFKNIPRADLEMLFPNTQVRMRVRDLLLLGVPGLLGIAWMGLKAGAAIIGAAGVTWMLARSLLSEGVVKYPQPHEMAAMIAALVALCGIGGYLWRQWGAYKNRKMMFMKTLADNLYFKNLDNNAGVFFHLIDAAEEEECKEAVLAYHFLLRAAEGLTEKALDERVEAWFEKVHAVSIDFEVDDALRKLVDLELCTREGAGETAIHRAVPIDEGLRRLDRRWDNFFQYNT